MVTNIRSYALLIRVINDWNNLPDYIVNASSLTLFKQLLDKHWTDYHYLFNAGLICNLYRLCLFSLIINQDVVEEAGCNFIPLVVGCGHRLLFMCCKQLLIVPQPEVGLLLSWLDKTYFSSFQFVRGSIMPGWFDDTGPYRVKTPTSLSLSCHS